MVKIDSIQAVQVLNNEILPDFQIFWFYYAFLLGLGMMSLGIGMILRSINDQSVQGRIRKVRRWFLLLPLPIAGFGALIDVIVFNQNTLAYYFAGSLLESTIVLGGFWLGTLQFSINSIRANRFFHWFLVPSHTIGGVSS